MSFCGQKRAAQTDSSKRWAEDEVQNTHADKPEVGQRQGCGHALRTGDGEGVEIDADDGRLRESGGQRDGHRATARACPRARIILEIRSLSSAPRAPEWRHVRVRITEVGDDAAGLELLERGAAEGQPLAHVR